MVLESVTHTKIQLNSSLFTRLVIFVCNLSSKLTIKNYSLWVIYVTKMESLALDGDGSKIVEMLSISSKIISSASMQWWIVLHFYTSYVWIQIWNWYSCNLLILKYTITLPMKGNSNQYHWPLIREKRSNQQEIYTFPKWGIKFNENMILHKKENTWQKRLSHNCHSSFEESSLERLLQV